MNQLFGTGWGNAPITKSLEFVEVPVGQTCGNCDEPILATDSGIIMPAVFASPPGSDNYVSEARPYHRECNLRHVFGGLNHQKGLCHCFGGSEDPDPPGLTRHQAALEAVRYFEAESRR